MRIRLERHLYDIVSCLFCNSKWENLTSLGACANRIDTTNRLTAQLLRAAASEIAVAVIADSWLSVCVAARARRCRAVSGSLSACL